MFLIQLVVNMKISAIYKIQSTIKPERIYIGSSSVITDRWRLHLKNLRENKHHSIKLQHHYNKYGEIDLQFSILLGCDKEDLIKVEQYFIDSYNPYFNICKKAGSHLGMKRSKESCERIRQSKLGKKHFMYGKTHSDEYKKKMSDSLKGRVSPYKGHKASKESIQIRIDKITGHLVSEETRSKISKSNKGKKRSSEFCEQCKERERLKRLNKNNVSCT